MNELTNYFVGTTKQILFQSFAIVVTNPKKKDGLIYIYIKAHIKHLKKNKIIVRL